MEITWPILPTRVVAGYGATAGRLWTTLPNVLITGPLISDLSFLCRVFITVFSKALVSEENEQNFYVIVHNLHLMKTAILYEKLYPQAIH